MKLVPSERRRSSVRASGAGSAVGDRKKGRLRNAERRAPAGDRLVAGDAREESLRETRPRHLVVRSELDALDGDLARCRDGGPARGLLPPLQGLQGGYGWRH